MDGHPIVEGELANIELLENLYQDYQKKYDSLDPSWHRYFQELETASSFTTTNKQSSSSNHVDHVIDVLRRDGHLISSVNPISLNPSSFTFSLTEYLKSCVDTQAIIQTSKIEYLRKIYCDRIGFEYKHLNDKKMEVWIQDFIEQQFFKQTLTKEQKQHVLACLSRSELFETFLHTKYIGQKRFSLEGAETLIPMLDLLIEAGAEQGVQEFLVGMAHRGRLNVLANILNKSLDTIFSEFGEEYIPTSLEGMGDVKYHKGYTGEKIKTRLGKSVKISLSPNPSHLESVNAVVEGKTRAKQFLAGGEKARKKIIPILIHGDAAVSGQGVVYETLQLSQLKGYETGGTIHFVINNQIGFTTIPRDLRSTRYCTDIARAFGLPIFHVNAEDPDSCVQVTLLALEVRQRFHCDVFIDLNGYRKYGHNEGDEPAYTQPLECRLIKGKQSIRKIYYDQLLAQGILDLQVMDQLEATYKAGLREVHEKINQPQAISSVVKQPFSIPQSFFQSVETGVNLGKLISLAERFSQIPQGFTLHPKVDYLVKERLRQVKENKLIDWGLAEHLAYASLLEEGVSIRISGQDCCRGTFSHRHAIWVDQHTEKDYYPLAHLKQGQGKFEIVNSPLSEMAVLGFEYGYSVVCVKGLNIWEAQFGDFNNGAQIIIDQFIASAEQKWGQKSGLILFLPHGLEGQGPEHSSGRLERFLTLAGHDNLQIVNTTTPAQFFHLLRRQVKHQFEKPLIVFTPKGLLRYPKCVSALHEFTQGTFREIIDDVFVNQSEIKRLVLCSGRIYYDLLAEREKLNRKEIGFIRIEQLYPLHMEELKKLIFQYPHIQEVVWAQEEPQNMGAWSFMFPYLNELISSSIQLSYVGRERSATPATGSYCLHNQEHTNILKQVFKT
ncbi:2-oxoglutarate dehydrogenase E1 component [Candidatus Protochlamydia sp. R18]|uniref:2-oxoglutarate dehydrogenase E1 component n=1 Tax=Candidatus Protochlamydia sp. R18 TaxID=1353977 RepID=UPI0005AB76AF|nr:2-oxoglutarate dehydrogenase E1 component [Candidatus Protochlamydia sp. R18]